MTHRVYVGAVDADGSPIHLATHSGRFTYVGPQRPDTAGAQIIDLQGRLVLPGFVDGHIHLDKSFVVFDAPNAAAAVAAAPAARAVIRHGRYWGGPAQFTLDAALLQNTAGSTPT
jgi:cytosine/adenosine deaminase-related metal-dependent hydrolase